VEIVKRADTPWAGINADSGNLRVDGYAGFTLMAPYATSVHLKSHIAGPDGKPQPADWPRLLGILSNAGYRGYVGLEYEGTDSAEIQPLAAKLQSVVRSLSL